MCSAIAAVPVCVCKGNLWEKTKLFSGIAFLIFSLSPLPALCHNVQLLNYNMTVCTKRPCYQNIPRKQTHLAFLWNWIFVPGLLGFINVVAAETDRVGLVGSFCILFIFCISPSILIQLPAFLFDFCFQLCHPHTFCCLQYALVSCSKAFSIQPLSLSPCPLSRFWHSQ